LCVHPAGSIHQTARSATKRSASSLPDRKVRRILGYLTLSLKELVSARYHRGLSFSLNKAPLSVVTVLLSLTA